MGRKNLNAESVEDLHSVLMENENMDAKLAKNPAYMLRRYINAKKVATNH